MPNLTFSADASDWIAGAALLVSIASVAVTVWMNRSNQRSLEKMHRERINLRVEECEAERQRQYQVVLDKAVSQFRECFEKVGIPIVCWKRTAPSGFSEEQLVELLRSIRSATGVAVFKGIHGGQLQDRVKTSGKLRIITDALVIGGHGNRDVPNLSEVSV